MNAKRAYKRILFIYNRVGHYPHAYRQAGDHNDQMVRSGNAPYCLRDYFKETVIPDLI